MAEWYEELSQAFRYKSPELAAQGSLPETLYMAVTEAVGNGPKEVDFVHAVDFAGQEGFLIVGGDEAWFVVLEAPSKAEVSHLGDLRGGRYTERVTAGEKDFLVEASFEHDRLGDGNALEASYSKPYAQPGVYGSDGTVYEVDRGAKLREKFASWSTPQE
jgi:hypothetical protein